MDAHNEEDKTLNMEEEDRDLGFGLIIHAYWYRYSFFLFVPLFALPYPILPQPVLPRRKKIIQILVCTVLIICSRFRSPSAIIPDSSASHRIVYHILYFIFSLYPLVHSSSRPTCICHMPFNTIMKNRHS